jgi:glycosyltransferase involved in cell wall biosynthesis
MATEVLHVIARMNIGGTARYVENLVENISDSKIATGFVQGSEIEDDSTKTLPIIRIKNMGRKISPIKDFQAWRELLLIIRRERPKILHTHTFKAGVIGRLVPGTHKRVHTFHGHLFDDQSFSSVEKRVIKIVERFLARRTDLLISVGERVGVEIRAQGVGPFKKWISIAPGVDPLPHYEKKNARTQLGLQKEGILFGWMARVTSVKNPNLLVDLARKMPATTFVMAGGGDMLGTIREIAPTNLKVLGWVDASKFWSAVDIGISTSDNEGMPVALIEAQIAGIPVIATDVGSNSEVIRHGITGLITTKSVGALMMATNKLIQHPELRKKMSIEANLRAQKDFSVKKMVEKHRDYYRKLANQE